MEFYREDTSAEILPVGSTGYLVLRRPRRGLHWLRHLPWLRRWAYTPEVYPVTVIRRNEP